MKNKYETGLNESDISKERMLDDTKDGKLLHSELFSFNSILKSCFIDTMETESPDRIVEELIDAGYEFKSTSYRWTIIFLFALNILGRAVANVGFVSCAKIIQEIYGVNAIHTTMTVLPFNFTILLLLFPYGMIANKFGMAIPTRMAVIALIIGGWIRMLVDDGFFFLILGQSIIAIGNPLSLIAPAKIASIWFGDNQRALATMIGSLAMPLGSVIGFVMPFIFITDDDAVDTPASKSKFNNYIFWQNIVIMAMSIPIFFFIKNRPTIAPSVSELRDRYIKPKGNGTEVKSLLKNKNYILHVFQFTGIQVTFICFGAVMGQLISQFGYKATDNQFFGVSYILVGMIGSFIHATILDKHKQYKKQIFIIIVTNIIANLAMLTTLNTGSVVLLTFIVGFVGMGHLPNIAIGYQFATEIVYPIGDNITIGLMQLIWWFIGIIYTFMTAWFVKQGWKYTAVISLIVPLFMSLIISFFVKEDLRKHQESLRFSTSIRSSAISDLSREEIE